MKRASTSTKAILTVLSATLVLLLCPVSATGQDQGGHVDLVEMDWGDAPDVPLGAGYGTVAVNDGAAHAMGAPMSPLMGYCVDSEFDGQPSTLAFGDDENWGGPPVSIVGLCQNDDDEDGIVFVTPVIVGQQASIDINLVQSPSQCVMDAWIDFGIDGTFDEPADRIMTGVALARGEIHSFSFWVPPTATAGQSYSRFRCSSTGVALPTGDALDGEVEDHAVVIKSVLDFLDWGDAPDTPGGPGYKTLSINGGARHAIGPVANPFMGQCVDSENDGQPTAQAHGDDEDWGGPPLNEIGTCQNDDDEDGILFVSPLIAGKQATVNIDLTQSPAQCVMDAWLDFGIDLSFDEPADRIMTGVVLGPGAVHTFSFGVPQTASTGPSYARFRCSSAGVSLPSGGAPNGEVEDYRVEIEAALEYRDWGDAPDSPAGSGYETLSVNNGAVHGIGPITSPFMGQCVDSELDGQPSAWADGDDINNGGPPFHVIGTCQNADDEDGVTIPSPIFAGLPANILIDMTASPTGCLANGWIDYGYDGMFDEPADRIMTDYPLTAGVVNVVGIVVSPITPPPVDDTFARFRCSTAGGDLPFGAADDGEVEDYRLHIDLIGPDALDWGDAPDTPGTVGYRTLSVNNGAVHLMQGPNLGSQVDSEPDGQPTQLADGDDVNGIIFPPGDEDGILTLPPHIVDLDAGAQCLTLHSSTGGMVDAWMDWDHSGTFDADEYWSGIAGSALPVPPANAPTSMCFVLPGDELPGKTYLRLRISANGIIPPVPFGFWVDGEVEDHQVIVERDVTFNLDVLLEGPYQAGLMTTALNPVLPNTHPYGGTPWFHPGIESIAPIPPKVVDWLLMEVRSQPNPATIIHQEAVLLLDTGTVVDTSGVNGPLVPDVGFDSVYVVLRHRNHLDVMSKDKLDVSTGAVTFNFGAPGAAFGTNPMKDLGGGPGPFGMFAGDGDPSDALIGLSDFTAYLTEVVLGTTGYTPADYNMDLLTQALDFNLYIDNRAAGAASQVP